MQATQRIVASPVRKYRTPLPPPSFISIKKTTIFSCIKFLCFFPCLTGLGERLGRVLELSQVLVSTPYIMRADSHKGFALKLHDTVFQHSLVASNYPDTGLKEKQRFVSPIWRFAGNFPQYHCSPSSLWMSYSTKKMSASSPPALVSSRKLTHKEELCMY